MSEDALKPNTMCGTTVFPPAGATCKKAIGKSPGRRRGSGMGAGVKIYALCEEPVTSKQASAGTTDTSTQTSKSKSWNSAWLNQKDGRTDAQISGGDISGGDATGDDGFAASTGFDDPTSESSASTGEAQQPWYKRMMGGQTPPWFKYLISLHFETGGGGLINKDKSKSGASLAETTEDKETPGEDEESPGQKQECKEAACHDCDNCLSEALHSTECSDIASDNACFDPAPKDIDMACARKIKKCSKKGPCYRKLMCQNSCICDSWKADKCKDKWPTVDYNETQCHGAGHGASMIQRRAAVLGRNGAEAAKLERVLGDKCVER